jgi:hypothetical protein
VIPPPETKPRIATRIADDGMDRLAEAGPSPVLLAQGAFYVATGLWSLFGINTFQRVTGPKHDVWLVKTVGVIVTVIGAVLASAALRRRVTPEVEALAVGSAAGLAGIDVVYVARRRISPVYLLDAVAEVTLIGLWGAARRRRRRS